MNVDISPGKYVLAVSGGVDSMVLLNLLRQKPGVELVVAHFNHGMRPDALKDEKLVTSIAKTHNIKYELGSASLKAGASEAQARDARYAFLQEVKKANKAKSIITAHHQDDLIETAALNILRGSGRRGITSIADNVDVKRPLLNIPKAEIIKYAKTNKLSWREDSTNKEDIYLRNYLRKHILGIISHPQRVSMLKNVEKVAKINKKLNTIIATLSRSIISNGSIDRHKFIMLPPEIANELLVYWLRQQNLAYDHKLIKRLSLSIKTAKAGTLATINNRVSLKFDADTVLFSTCGHST